MNKNNSKTQLAILLLSTLCLLTSAYAQITPLQDAYTDSAKPTTNYGSATTLAVDGATDTTYIQFNLASIPSGSSVSQATLKLYADAVTTAGSFNVDYVNGTWSESTITYNMAPALGVAIASNITITKSDKNQYILIDITPAVTAWLNGSQTNDGIALVANGSFNASFDSKEATKTSHPAELDIAYAGGEGTITGVTTASGSGLTGGGMSGTLNLSMLTSCASKQILQWNGSAWACSNAGTGTITGVTAGTDLTGGGTGGNVTLNLDTTKVPQLAANNTFSGTQTINNAVTMSQSSSGGVLQVTNTVTTGTGPAIVGTTDSTGANAIKGIVNATGGTSAGLYGQTSSPSGLGVNGQSPNVGVFGATSGGNPVDPINAGVWGQGTNTASGVVGTGTTISGTGQNDGGYAGVWGDSSGSLSAVLGTADNGIAGAFYNNSNFWSTLYLVNDGSGGTGGAVLVAEGELGVCDVDTDGNVGCTGKVTSVVPADNGARKVSLYATQSTENWFEDAGSGQLSNGSASIALEPTFAQTVNAGVEYHVFLTPKGDCEGLYVSNETPQGFEVHELRGGRSSIGFDYRIMAKRVGYENVRLEDVTERSRQMEKQRQLRRQRMAQRRTTPIASEMIVPHK